MLAAEGVGGYKMLLATENAVGGIQCTLAEVKFNESNYLVWARSVKVSLGTRGNFQV